MPKTMGVKIISANLRLNKKKIKPFKEIYIIIVIAIISIIGIIYTTNNKNEEIIKTSQNNDDLIENIKVNENNNAFDNISPNINGNNINFNINFKKIESFIEYNVTINNNSKKAIILKSHEIKTEEKLPITIEVLNINDNIIIMPNTKRDFKIKIIYTKNDEYNLPINSTNINVNFKFIQQ